jgi:hypothetical protein
MPKSLERVDEHVPLFEGIGIEQQREAFACAQLALGVLGLDPPLAAAHARGTPLVLELTQDLLHWPSPIVTFL